MRMNMLMTDFVDDVWKKFKSIDVICFNDC